jgi:hypothetical protein
MLKRYLVFTFYDYYPSGGWNDFHGSYGTLKAAESALTQLSGPDNFEIVDSKTSTVIKRGNLK